MFGALGLKRSGGSEGKGLRGEARVGGLGLRVQGFGLLGFRV